MKGRARIGVVVAMAIGVLWTAPGASGATPAAGHFRYAIDSHPDFSSLAQTAQRRDYVILQAWRQDEMAEIKAADPTTKVLVYKNMTSSRLATNPDGFASSGVPLQEADSHEDWFLHDKTSGDRFNFDDYPSVWAMNVASPGYQKRWADNVVSELQSEGWDGVFMDNVDTTMKWNYEVSQIAEHDTDAKWQAATESALSYIGGRVQAAGKLAIPNIGSFGGNADVARSWLQYVDGAMDENFVKWGTEAGEGYAWEGHWDRQIGSLKYAQDHGKVFLARTGSANDDGDAARYGWASLLLGAAGKAHFALHDDYTTETWFPEYEYELGEPQGPESRDPNGVHRRLFANGIVVVNPTSSQRSAELCGTYSGSGLEQVTSVTLDSYTAAILTRDGDSSGEGCEGEEPGDDTGDEDPPGGGKPPDDGEAGGDDPPDGEGDTSGDGGTDDPVDYAPEDDGPIVQPRSKGVKKGKIVAKGRVRAHGRATLASSDGAQGLTRFDGETIRLKVRRRGGGTKARDIGVRRNGRFVGRIRVCRTGRYKLIARSPHFGTRRWPGMVRVRRTDLRC